MDLQKTIQRIYSKLGTIKGLGAVASFNGTTASGIFSLESQELGFNEKSEVVLANKITFQYVTIDLPGIKVNSILSIGGKNYKVRNIALQNYGLTTILYLMNA